MGCWLLNSTSIYFNFLGLNPYSTGSWVAGKQKKEVIRNNYCLNPYSTGSWVAGVYLIRITSIFGQGLNPYSTGSWVAGLLMVHLKIFIKKCLNPYSTGSWVAGRGCENPENLGQSVLILILLEVGLLEDKQ